MIYTFTVGTRGSALAIAQTKQIIALMQQQNPDATFSIKIIQTKGDAITEIPLDKIGDKGLFVSEIEHQLLSGQIDIAIHSYKDLPSNITPGLIIAHPPARAPRQDALVLRDGTISSLDAIPRNATIATGSLRRKLQLLHHRPDLNVVPIRGNIDTRLKKLSDVDGIVIAAAGLARLDLAHKISYLFPEDILVPAAAQGAIAIQCRATDTTAIACANSISDSTTALEVSAERAFLSAIDGSCHIPVGATAHLIDDTMYLKAIFGDTTTFITHSAEAHVTTEIQAQALGIATARSVLAQINAPSHAGMVYLVGAGPGDPGLLTLKALECIQKADVIVYDKLANPAFLASAKPSCKLIDAGKVSANHTLTQDQINETLAANAQDDVVVTRLKGGDPYVFGRGAEEAEYLAERGIPFEVVPGITSAIGGLCYAGIPVTHRNFASSFHVITGHQKANSDAINWPALATVGGTLIFLMGIANLESICYNLITHGLATTTPAAIVTNATTPHQQIVIGTLATLTNIAKSNAVTSPGIIVVGDVVSLQNQLDFFTKKPLFGKTIVVTRARSQSSSLSTALADLGAHVIEAPAFSIEPHPDNLLATIKSIDSYDFIAFTSQNGVEIFFETLFASGLDARSLAHAQITAIGSATASKLQQYGIHADIIPPKANSESLLAVLESIVTPAHKLLLVTATNSRDLLLNLSCHVDKVCAYATVPATTMPSIAAADYITFTCSSAVENFMAISGNANIIAKTVSIGNVTSAALQKYGLSIDLQAATATIADLVDTIVNDV